MNITASDLDTRIQLQPLPSAMVRDEIGAVTEVPGAMVWVWAKVQDLRGRELVAQAQANVAAEARAWIRWRPDVTSQSRVYVSGRLHSIVGRPIMVGRREFIELMLTSGPAEVGQGVAS
jgi:SPP1 family predicted phage head-tail adaptor